MGVISLGIGSPASIVFMLTFGLSTSSVPVSDPNGEVITVAFHDRSIIVLQNDRTITPSPQDRVIHVEARDI